MNQHNFSTGASRVRRSWALVVMTGALLAAVACSDDGSGEARGSSEAAGDESAESQTFPVDQIVEDGLWQVRVHTVTDPYTLDDEYWGPSEGTRWVAVDAEVLNMGTEPAHLSSLLCFELFDNSNVVYDVTVTPESELKLDGEVAAGSSVRDTVVFEVTEGVTGLQLKVDCDLLTETYATVDLGR